jgi:hypothetical protein
MLVLLLQNRGFRLLEAVVITLVATVGACFIFEIVIARPDIGPLLRGFIPSPSIIQDKEKLYIAVGILGATVMPHNLYLHSSIVQTRSYDLDSKGKAEAIRYSFIDSTVALSMALFINAAILIVAAATFHRTGYLDARALANVGPHSGTLPNMTIVHLLVAFAFEGGSFAALAHLAILDATVAVPTVRADLGLGHEFTGLQLGQASFGNKYSSTGILFKETVLGLQASLFAEQQGVLAQAAAEANAGQPEPAFGNPHQIGIFLAFGLNGQLLEEHFASKLSNNGLTGIAL